MVRKRHPATVVVVESTVPASTADLFADRATRERFPVAQIGTVNTKIGQLQHGDGLKVLTFPVARADAFSGPIFLVREGLDPIVADVDVPAGTAAIEWWLRF